jgi:putative acetyltransferase
MWQNLDHGLLIVKTYDKLIRDYIDPYNFNNWMAMTTQKILIRDEIKDDTTTITEVTAAAFETLEISSHAEQFIIEALRSAKALTLSLVAEVDGQVVGHIAFSPVTISDGTEAWYGLGPVSVLPGYQRMGIGKALVREGLSRLKGLDAKGCCLVGHPQYYRKFGFENVPGLVIEGIPPEVFFALSFDGHYPHGKVSFHEGFQATGQPVQAGDVTAPRP